MNLIWCRQHNEFCTSSIVAFLSISWYSVMGDVEEDTNSNSDRDFL